MEGAERTSDPDKKSQLSRLGFSYLRDCLLCQSDGSSSPKTDVEPYAAKKTESNMYLNGDR
jgi:hypothetical protein